MARKYSNKRMSKIEPAVMTLTMATPGSGAATSYIDLSQVASIVNRRFYRQGINWAVAGFKFVTLQPGVVQISKLPNTWTMANSWVKGFKAWQRQQDEVLEDGDQESVRARFNDFKIYADATHAAATTSANLLPSDALGNLALPGEWEPSQIVIPNFGSPGNNYEPFITAVGDYVGGVGGSISLIKAYQSSRGTPQSPDPAVPSGVTNTDNIWRALFDVGDNNEDVLENVVGKNNDLPYVQDDYPGGATQMPGLEWHDQVQIFSPSGVPGVGLGTQRGKGGNFPCGLIRIDWTPDGVNANLVIQIDLVPGNHRGYLCEPMTEM